MYKTRPHGASPTNSRDFRVKSIVFVSAVVCFGCAVVDIGFSSGSEDGEYTPQVTLTYTYRFETSKIMRHLSNESVTLHSWAIGYRDNDDDGRAWNQCRGSTAERMLGAAMLEAADVFTLCRDDHFGALEQYIGNDGLFRTIPVETINSETPNLLRLMQSYPRLFETYVNDDGLIAVPGIDETLSLPRRLVVIRYDWLKDAIDTQLVHLQERLKNATRIEIGPDELVRFFDLRLSLSDLFDIISVIAARHFDAHSPIAHNEWHDIWPTIMGAFSLPVYGSSRGTNVTPLGVPNTSDRRDNVVRASVLTSQYCDYVEEASRWYRSVLPADVFERGDSKLIEDLFRGDAAVILSGDTLLNWEEMVTNVRATSNLDSSATLAILPPPHMYSQGTHTRSVRNGTFMMVGQHVSDRDLQIALQMLDFVKFTRDGYVLETYGLADQHYEWASNQIANEAPPAIIVDNSETPYFPRYPSFMSSALYAVAYDQTAVNMMNIVSGEAANLWAQQPGRWLGKWRVDVSDRLQAIGAEVNELIEASFRHLVTSDHDSEELRRQCEAFQSDVGQGGVGEAWGLTSTFGVEYFK